MLATILSIIISIIYFLFFNKVNFYETFIFMLIASFSIWFLMIGLYARIWVPLQKQAQNLSPGIVNIIKKDLKINFIIEFISCLPLIALASFMIYHPSSLAFLLIAFGISIDLIKIMLFQLNNFLDVESLLEIIVQQKGNKKFDNENELIETFDIVFDIANIGIEKKMPSISINAIDSMQKIMQSYLNNVKRASNSAIIDDSKYLILNFIERIRSLNVKAIHFRAQEVISKILNALAKIAIASSKVDLTFPNYFMHLIGEISEQAIKEKMLSVAEKATCILLEMGKYILPQISLENANGVKFYFSLIRKIEEINKLWFQADKSINIELLIQPLKELSNIFENIELQSMPDQKLILNEIKRAIDQFEQLDLVMKTIPPFDLEQLNENEK